MGFFSFLDPVMDAAFGWLLNLSYFWAIVLLSFVLAMLISLIYKYTTNQSLMKDLKMEVKELQKEMKALKHDPQKMMQVQKKAMETNMKYMMHSMKPMLFTFIPIIIIFGWMSAHFAYQPITPGEEFTTTVLAGEEIEGNITLVAPEEIEVLSNKVQEIEEGRASWELKGKEKGSYILEYWYGEKSYAKDVLITDEKDYEQPTKNLKREELKSITVEHKPVKIINLYIRGWKLGWIGTYIIFSLIFSLIIRKALKIY